MSRLQQYLKTPNPLSFQLFNQHSCHHQNTPHLFNDNEGQLTKGVDQSNFQRFGKSLGELNEIKINPFSKNFANTQQNIIQEKLVFDDMSDELIETPIEKIQKNQVLQTTAQKKYDLRVAGTMPLQINDSKQTERSLRILTSEAYNVVCRKGPLTYKLVSQQIINDTCDLLNSRQQNNIKRRVYDALNVLIALGKLQKKGRKILISKNSEQQRAHLQKISQLKRVVLDKERNLVTKRKIIISLNKIFSRNKVKSVSHKKNMQKIQIPFIIAKCEGIKSIKEISQTHIKVLFKNNEQKIYMEIQTQQVQ